MLYIGEIYFKQQQYKAAEKQWQAALKLEDNNQIFIKDLNTKLKTLEALKTAN